MRVAVVTGGRSDYWLLRPTIRAIANDDRYELQLIAAAMHLSPRFGMTVDEIEFPISARVDTRSDDEDEGAFARRMAAGVIGFDEAFAQLSPDVLLVLGDRHEMLAAVLAATGRQIPVIHAHGGELSEGSLDDAMRHSITKFAQLHVVSSRAHAERLCQLGERPDRVRVTGAAALDAIRELELLSRDQLAASLEMELNTPLIALTLHAASLDPARSGADAAQVLAALTEALPAEATIVATLPNDDPGAGQVRVLLERWIAERRHGRAFAHLGHLRYLSLLSHADLLVGNSSSGLIEAPEFNLPVINVRPRQDGRAAAACVISCDPLQPELVAAIRQALTSDFRRGLGEVANPYGGSSMRDGILDAVAELALPSASPRVKRFLDLPDGAWRATLGLR